MDKFDEYKFFAQSTQDLASRRQAATQTYLTVNTAVFAVLSFVAKEQDLEGWGVIAISFPLFAVGILACLMWQTVIQQYKVLIGWRYQQLILMEQEMAQSHQIYTKEKQFFEPRQGRQKFGFSRLEIWLPRLFLALYAVVGGGFLSADRVN